MFKTPSTGAINYGPVLPAVGSVADGTLFFLTAGADPGLYIHATQQDASSGTLGAQPALAWTKVIALNPNDYVQTIGDTMTGPLVISDTTTATSTTTGALQVAGGAGIGGAVIANRLGVNTVAGTFSAPDIFWVNDDGSNLGFYRSGDDTLSLSATTGQFVEFNAASGYANSFVRLFSTNAATSTTTGALRVDGGAGIAGALYVGGDTNLGGNVNVGGNLTVTGDLTVNLDTATFNVATLNIEDPIIRLGQSATDDNKDRGVSFSWRDTAARTGFFGFDDSSGKFTFVPQATVTSEVISGTVGTFDLSGTRLAELSDVVNYTSLTDGTILMVDSGSWTPMPYNVVTSIANSTGGSIQSATGESQIRLAINDTSTTGAPSVAFSTGVASGTRWLQATFSIPAYSLDVSPTGTGLNTTAFRLRDGSATPADTITLNAGAGLSLDSTASTITFNVVQSEITGKFNTFSGGVNSPLPSDTTAFPNNSVTGFDARSGAGPLDFPDYGGSIAQDSFVGLTIKGSSSSGAVQMAVAADIVDGEGPRGIYVRTSDGGIWNDWRAIGVACWGHLRVANNGQNTGPTGANPSGSPYAGYNINSIQDLTGGNGLNFRIVFKLPMPSDRYSVVTTTSDGSIAFVTNKTTTYFDLDFTAAGGTDLDYNFIVVI